jgi:hypothetical protein
VLLHALESLFKLCHQRSFAGLETVASCHTPEKTATRPQVRVVHSHQIFGRPARHQDDNVGIRGLVHDHQFAPILDSRSARWRSLADLPVAGSDRTGLRHRRQRGHNQPLPTLETPSEVLLSATYARMLREEISFPIAPQNIRAVAAAIECENPFWRTGM